MAGQKFQYDESGGTFFYFVLSFLALILIPTTLYFWPSKKKEDPDRFRDECQCPGCIKKRRIIATSEPYKHYKSAAIKLAICAGWCLLALLAYRVSQFDYEAASFDPYEILGIPLGTGQSEIKKAYRKLSLQLHPDKETGDEKAFMKLSKAYQALTDDEARKNWEKYGNPDGPGAMSFGIALPSWIVEKENSVWVLGLYALVFMVAMPVVVGTWWYQSIRFSGDKVLLDTTQMYFYFFHKTPQMALKRVIMILAASLEFDKRHNSQVTERPSDNEEVPQLIRQLPNLNEKCKELPLCRMYSVKTRAILHAHLSRMALNEETLDKDRQFVVAKSPYLIQEMVSCVNQLIMLAYARRISKLPSIETIENCMKLSPMVLQGLWEFKSPFLQLPFVTDDHLRLFMTKKRHIKNLQQFAQLPAEESRHVLKHLSDGEYENVMRVLGRMPLIDFSIRCEVIDDENTNVVTAGAIVTVTVSLVRQNMSELFGDANAAEKASIDDDDASVAAANGDGGENGTETAAAPTVVKRSAWSRPNKNKKSVAAPKKRGVTVKSKVAPNAAAPEAAPKSGVANGSANKPTAANNESDAADSDDETDSVERGDNNGAAPPSSDEETTNTTSTKKAAPGSSPAAGSNADDDDVEWEKFQQKLNRREKLEGKSKMSHSVHCPYYPEDKQEYWWTYICDRKSRTLLTAPYHVTNLVDSEEIQLKFTAPRWPGVYTFTVCLRSDSYMGMDQQQELKLDVKEAPVVSDDHPQWDLSESEEEKYEEQGNESEFTTDSSDNED